MDTNELLRRARAAGCEVLPTRNGHWRVLCPGGGIVIVAKSPSDYRAVRNELARFRRYGVEL